MEDGGNAFDAMIVQLALSVSHPTAEYFRRGFMVYKLSDGSEGSLDFRASSLADMYLDEDGNVIPGLTHWRSSCWCPRNNISHF